jgi:hypothetical protein
MSDTQTKPPAAAPAEPTLSELLARIKAEHSCLIGLGRRCVDYAISIGEDLIKAKVLVGHGNFLKWVKDNCGFADKTAERYMKFAENKAKLIAMEKIKFETISNLTLNAAERLIDGSQRLNASDTYDKVEKRLIKKLMDLDLEAAEAAMKETNKKLREAVELKRSANTPVKKAA